MYVPDKKALHHIAETTLPPTRTARAFTAAGSTGAGSTWDAAFAFEAESAFECWMPWPSGTTRKGSRNTVMSLECGVEGFGLRGLGAWGVRGFLFGHVRVCGLGFRVILTTLSFKPYDSYMGS